MFSVDIPKCHSFVNFCLILMLLSCVKLRLALILLQCWQFIVYKLPEPYFLYSPKCSETGYTLNIGKVVQQNIQVQRQLFFFVNSIPTNHFMPEFPRCLLCILAKLYPYSFQNEFYFSILQAVFFSNHFKTNGFLTEITPKVAQKFPVFSHIILQFYNSDF